MSVVAMEVASPAQSTLTGPGWIHDIAHEFDGWVLVQVYDNDGRHILLPGSGKALRQIPNEKLVRIPVLNGSYYPITVVMMGNDVR